MKTNTHQHYDNGRSDQHISGLAKHVKRLRILPADNAQAELVACDRYRARITEATCQWRYRAANRSNVGTGVTNHCEGCRKCAQGADRAV